MKASKEDLYKALMQISNDYFQHPTKEELYYMVERIFDILSGFKDENLNLTLNELLCNHGTYKIICVATFMTAYKKVNQTLTKTW